MDEKEEEAQDDDDGRHIYEQRPVNRQRQWRKWRWKENEKNSQRWGPMRLFSLNFNFFKSGSYMYSINYFYCFV